MAGPRRDLGRRGVVEPEALVGVVRPRERAGEPGEEVAEAGLARLVAPEAADRPVLGDALDPGGQRPVPLRQEEVDGRRPEGADEAAGGDRAEGGQDGVRVDHRHGDDGRAGDPGSCPPGVRQAAGGRADGLRRRQALHEPGDDVARVAGVGIVLRLVRGEAQAARLATRQLPHQPVTGLDESAGLGPDARAPPRRSRAAFASSHSPETLPPKFRRNAPPLWLIASAWR